jgi:hypothetical protein
MCNQNINDHAVEVILDHNRSVCTDTNTHISVISAVITITEKQEILALVYTVSKSDFLFILIIQCTERVYSTLPQTHLKITVSYS